jgi:hypothetical protein
MKKYFICKNNNIENYDVKKNLYFCGLREKKVLSFNKYFSNILMLEFHYFHNTLY